MSEARKQDRPFVFILFDIFKHLRGLYWVDKIKKYRRDNPLGIFTHLGHGLSTIHSCGDYKFPRESLPVFLIIICVGTYICITYFCIYVVSLTCMYIFMYMYKCMYACTCI